ncbi:MAG: hypothetical protein KQH57_16595 [Actinomycetales bacterium]|nr:hypothetical protein [Actinomycetales bacterium]
MSTTTLGRSTSVMAAGTAVSRVTGLVRAAVLAAAIGVNAAGASAFGVANWLPNMLFLLIAGGVLNAVLVPQVVRAYRSDTGQEYVDRLLTVSVALLLAVTVVLTAAAPVIVWLAAANEAADFLPFATAFAFWCIPQVFFYGVYTVLGQVLNARGIFGPYMWAPLANNVVSVVGFGTFIAVYGGYAQDGPLAEPAGWGAAPIALLGGTATVGILAQAVVLVFPLRRIGFRFRPRWDWRRAGLGSAGRVAGWTFAALAAGQVGILVVTRITTAAAQVSGYAPDVASNAAYNNSFAIFMLPHSLVTVSLLTAMFTRLSGHAASGDTRAVRHDASITLRSVGVFTVIATAVISVLALPLVRIALPSTSPAVAGSLAPVVVALTAGLTALGAWSLVQRVNYAYEDARGLFRIQVAMAAVVALGALVGGLVLDVRWWTAAASAAITASFVVGAVWGGIAVRRRLGGSGRRILVLHAKAGIAAAAAAVVGWPLSRLFGDLSAIGFATAVLVCLVVGAVMLGVYAALLHVLGVDELTELSQPVLAAARRSMGVIAARLRRTDTAGEGARVDVAVGQGTVIAGRYRLDHPTSCDLPGAECWTAHDQILDRKVRVLLLREGRVRQAQDAARRAALVTDPRLLRVIDVGDHESVAYVVTERLPGRDLAQLTAHGPLPADQARAIVGEAAVALEVARRRGVHHLALRPSAVHVTPAGGVVVSGLAVDGELGDHGLGDARSTTRADTVALVSLLYLGLTGRWPSPDGAPMHGAAPAPLLSGRPIAPAEITPGVPNDLDTLCTVTLGPNDDGPHSPAELVRELEPWGTITATEPVPARVRKPSRDADTAVDGPEVAEVEAAGADLPAEAEDGETASGQVQRQSVLGGPVAPPARPGTPPPAILPRIKRADPRVAAAAAGAAAVSASAPPPDAASADAAPDVAPVDGGTLSADALLADAPQAAAPATSTTDASKAPRGRTAPDHPPRGSANPGRPGGGRPPVTVPAASGEADEHRTFDELLGKSTDVLVRKRFDPTPIVLLLVAVAVVIGVVMAWQALTRPAPSLSGSTDGFVDVSQTPTASPTDQPTDGTGTPSPTDTPSSSDAPTVAPVIASAQQVDPPPDGDNNEHPELVGRAIDGDPTTMWVSRTYKSPTYGMKKGIGFAVLLQQPATVTQVTLQTASTGGNVEVRATTPDKPTEGPVLASGPLTAGTTVLTFSKPVETGSIVLWWTALPQTSDGSNRVELYEVTVQ